MSLCVCPTCNTVRADHISARTRDREGAELSDLQTGRQCNMENSGDLTAQTSFSFHQRTARLRKRETAVLKKQDLSSSPPSVMQKAEVLPIIPAGHVLLEARAARRCQKEAGAAGCRRRGLAHGQCVYVEHVAGRGGTQSREHTCGAESTALPSIYSHFTLRV